MLNHSRTSAAQRYEKMPAGGAKGLLTGFLVQYTAALFSLKVGFKIKKSKNRQQICK